MSNMRKPSRLGALIRPRRRALGLSQEDLATLLDIGIARISEMEGREGFPMYRVEMEKISSKLDIDLETIMSLSPMLKGEPIRREIEANSCIYNLGVLCTSKKKCSGCCWNPKVAKERREALRYANSKEHNVQESWVY